MKTEKKKWANQKQQCFKAFDNITLFPYPEDGEGGGLYYHYSGSVQEVLKKIFIPVCVAYKIVVNNLIYNKQKWNKSHSKSIIS